MTMMRRYLRVICVGGIAAVLTGAILVSGAIPARATTVVEIAAEGGRTCALTAAGTVRCWGRMTSTPQPVDGLPDGLQGIAAGHRHVCVITSTGGVLCWGSNTSGQLGDGTTISRDTPAEVPGLTGVNSLAAGEASTCAVTATGAAMCWGANDGDGDGVVDLTPTGVVGLGSGVEEVAVGSGFTCALLTSGGIRCWGAGGHLGDGSDADSEVPVDVVGLPVAAAALGAGQDHACAVLVDGRVLCWGSNAHGALGDGTKNDRTSPVEVVGLPSAAVTASGGLAHTCASLADGGVACWGSSRKGRLGDGRPVYLRTRTRPPVRVTHLTEDIVGWAIWSHTCALTDVGGVRCWGPNRLRQLGDGTDTPRSTPIGVWGLPGDPGDAYRPDGSVGTNVNGPFTGERLYGTDGDGQTLGASVRPGEKAIFWVRFTNRSDLPDHVFVHATRRDSRFGVHYSFRNGRDITDDIAGELPVRRARDAYRVIALPPHGWVSIKVKINVVEGTPRGSSKTVLLVARSGGNSRMIDAVAATVTVGA